MWTLKHIWLSPACRMVRVALAEKKQDFTLQMEPTWERRQEFLQLNPAGEVPVLVGPRNQIFADTQAILQYLEEEIPEPPLFGHTSEGGAEVRRLLSWFLHKFDREVSAYLINEKIMKRFLGMGTPNSQAIRAAKQNIVYHMDYIAWLIDRRTWLAGDTFSMADIAAAAQLSCVDYLGDVAWDKHKTAKEWYMSVKSRPSFRPLLADNIAGVTPPKHYANLDF